jgi:hypothetical protein
LPLSKAAWRGFFDLLDLTLDDLQAIHVASHLGQRVPWYGGTMRRA